MYQTVGDFGREMVKPVGSAGSSTDNNGKGSAKRLPRIIFALAEETDDDTLSQYTAVRGNTVFFPGGPKLHNPMLPVHLNRDLSNMTNPNEKKFELPPQATVAMYNERDGIIEDPSSLIEDLKSRTYQPKWTKVSNSRHYYSKHPKTSAQP